jgi:3-oxoacyl-(acyl-carrier-protein) synthase
MTPGRRARCCRERNLVAKESSVRATRPQVLAASQRPIGAALSNSFAFGGLNAVIAIRRFTA